MAQSEDRSVRLPSPEQIRCAIELYVELAYEGEPSEAARALIPADNFEPREWLMRDPVERTPADASLPDVRSFALRLGNSTYPHMKLRLSRPPRHGRYVFSVDCHDACLCAPEGSPDHEALEELKRHNCEIAGAVNAALDRAGLPTERNYLREKIREARRPGG